MFSEDEHERDENRLQHDKSKTYDNNTISKRQSNLGGHRQSQQQPQQQQQQQQRRWQSTLNPTNTTMAPPATAAPAMKSSSTTLSTPLSKLSTAILACFNSVQSYLLCFTRASAYYSIVTMVFLSLNVVVLLLASLSLYSSSPSSSNVFLFLSSLCTLCLVTYGFSYRSPRDAHCFISGTNDGLIDALRANTGLFNFRPVPLLRSGDLASLLVLCRPVRVPPFTDHVLTSECGGTIGYYTLDPDTPWPEVTRHKRYKANEEFRKKIAHIPISRRPTIIILPGIAGTKNSVFNRSIARACYEKGFRAVANAYRGCDVPLTSPRTFSLGNTGDLEAVLRDLKKTRPESPLFLVGSSMGANITSCYLGTTNADVTSDLYGAVKGGISFCNGFYLDYESLQSRFMGFYDYAVTENAKTAWIRCCSLEVQKALENHPEIDIKRILKARSLVEYDRLVVKAVYGYDTIDEYAQQESSGYHLHRVNVPLLCVNASNDPLFTPKLHARIRNTVQSNPEVTYVETEWGGHLGFMESPEALTNPDCGPHLIDQIAVETANYIWQQSGAADLH